MGRRSFGLTGRRNAFKSFLLLGLAVLLGFMFATGAGAFTLTVTGSDGTPVTSYRWLLEEDNTNLTVPGANVSDSISNSIHNSYAPVALRGTATTSSVAVDIPASMADKRFYVSVLPTEGYGMAATTVSVGQETVNLVVEAVPWPTAQISVYAFVDQNLINDGPDDTEQGLGGAGIFLYDYAGQVFYDAFGNPLGTSYLLNADNTVQLDQSGAPVVDVIGNGVITTLTRYDYDRASDPTHPDYNPKANPWNLNVGEALVKYLVPGKYGIRVIPPEADDAGETMTWTQTTTIEGTPTIDAWIKANEPKVFVEGFGAGLWHAAFGFVKTGPPSSQYKGQTLNMLPWNIEEPQGTATIEGTLRVNHFSRPPNLQGYFPGEPVKDAWVALNDPTVQPAIDPGGLFATACDPSTGKFKIEHVPAGTYTLVNWDEPLDMLFGFRTVTVQEGEHLDLGDVLVFQWFGHISGQVFYDTNQNGFPDSTENGVQEQALTLRYRDGTIYQGTTTDNNGYYSFSEVFPFFKWLVLEVDFARLKATGMTSVADYGGEVFPDEGWDWPSRDVLYPQPQSVGHPPTAEVINPNTGNNLSRTETGVVLTQATQTFLGQYNEVNWGKTDYTEDENGGISGLVYYASTRTSDEPRYDTVEPWEPGIPRVRVNLYQDANKDGVIDDLPSDVDRTPLQWTGTWMPQTYTGIPGPEDTDWNKNGIFDQAVSGIQYPDVDNYPFQWTDKEYEGYTGLPGIEDIDRNGDKRFYWGDALRIGVTDSWDDSKPTGCIQDLPVVHGQTVQECADSFGTWNQVRPGIFDGGYAFDDIDMGTYIVEVVPPISVSGQDMYEVVRSQDKNTDFGVEWVPSTQNASVNNDILINPPVCVGPDYVVPEYLTLFPGVEAPLAGQTLADCNMKQVSVLQSRNAAADFFLKTDVPKSARVVGFVNNDLGAEFNMASPNYGEKLAASWIPIAMRDWTGREFQRMYSDEYGGYNCLLPSSYTNNVPSPSGMSPNMITMVLNDPTLPDGTEDPYYNPLLSVTPWTFQYYPGVTTYTDTPLVPLAAFASSNDVIDTEPPDYTPVIASVLGPESKTGPLLCSNRANGSTITLTSVGDRLVLNPDWDPQVAGSIFKITRHYGFGDVAGSVTLNGAPLTIESWNDQQIRATVGSASTGRIMVTRGDNGLSTEIGVTLNIVNCASTNVVAVPGDFGTIQGAIDATTTGPGALILVAPGAYNENVIMYKPVRLQGSGAGGTLINANPNPYERLQIWHDRIEQPPPAGLGGAEFATFIGGANPFVQNEAPGIFVAGQTAYPGGTALNPDPTITKYFNQGYPFTIQGQAAIDGFKLLGSKAGGGIYTFTGAVGLEVSNNEITGNQGNLGGGIALGLQGIGWNGVNNNNIVIARNKIHRNGGVQGGGGITINDYAADYLIEENIIAGNFSRFNGGGINHGGVCPGENVIRYNKILFNENFFGALLNNAGDGGGIYIGGNAAGGTGTGNVTVNANLIQGNLTGSGSGGGIHVFAANGEDLKDFPLQPADWYKIKIFNNMIVNNVAAYKGAGIYMQDVLRGYILQNTIINNDSTGTSALAFEAGAANSTPQASGVVTAVNSDALQLILATSGPTEPDYSNPVLVNNIIWHNRSGYNNASLNNGAGGLAANPNGLFWDVYVPAGENNTRHLNPVRCFLSQQVDPNTGYDYGTNNFYVDPLVVDSYVNTLESTTIVDEGGNNISVRYSPLMPAQGNYHIQAGSPARDNGRSVVSYGFTPLQWDFDGQTRNTVMPDVGADEYQ